MGKAPARPRLPAPRRRRHSSACPSDSIDYAVMEKTEHAAVLPVDIGWSDVGSWTALWEVGDKDARRQRRARRRVTSGTSRNCYVRAESRMVSALGVREPDRRRDRRRRARRRPLERAQEVKEIVEPPGRAETEPSTSLTRASIDPGASTSDRRRRSLPGQAHHGKPGAALSLQMHHHRAEHWVVVQRHGAGDARRREAARTRTSPPTSRSARSTASRTPARSRCI